MWYNQSDKINSSTASVSTFSVQNSLSVTAAIFSVNQASRLMLHRTAGLLALAIENSDARVFSRQRVA